MEEGYEALAIAWHPDNVSGRNFSKWGCAANWMGGMLLDSPPLLKTTCIRHHGLGSPQRSCTGEGELAINTLLL
jgi:hypothetical protein